MKHDIAILWSWIVRLGLSWLPDHPVVMRLRGTLYGIFMKSRGRDFQVAGSASLVGLEKIAVGNHVYIAPGAMLRAGEGIDIGDEVMIAFYSVVIDGNHTIMNGSYRYGLSRRRPVKIGRGVWIGAHCTILSGTVIGQGTVVAANSAVMGEMPDFAVVGGVPAKVIRLVYNTSTSDMEGKA